MERLKIASVVLFLVFSLNANAQLMPRMGIKGGLNSANISGLDGSNLQDFHLGAFMNMKIIVVGVQLEALYSRMGSEINANGEKLRNDYLQFPLVAKLFIIPGLLNLQGGVQYSVLVSSVFGGQDIKSAFSNGDWGIPLGLELEIFNRLQVTGRYVFGVSNIKSDEIPSLPSGSTELNNQLFQLSLGWKFGGK